LATPTRAVAAAKLALGGGAAWAKALPIGDTTDRAGACPRCAPAERQFAARHRAGRLAKSDLSRG